jgi:hypothetical protein
MKRAVAVTGLPGDKAGLEAAPAVDVIADVMAMVNAAPAMPKRHHPVTDISTVLLS